MAEVHRSRTSVDLAGSGIALRAPEPAAQSLLLPGTKRDDECADAGYDHCGSGRDVWHAYASAGGLPPGPQALHSRFLLSAHRQDRKSVVEGKGVAVSVDNGG